MGGIRRGGVDVGLMRGGVRRSRVMLGGVAWWVGEVRLGGVIRDVVG